MRKTFAVSAMAMMLVAIAAGLFAREIRVHAAARPLACSVK